MLILKNSLQLLKTHLRSEATSRTLKTGLQSEEVVENNSARGVLGLKVLSGNRQGLDPSNVHWDRGQRAVVSEIRSWSPSNVSSMSLNAIVKLDLELTDYGRGADVLNSRRRRWKTLLGGEGERVNVCDARVEKYRDHGMDGEAERLRNAWNEALKKKSYGERLLIACEIYWTAAQEQQDALVYTTLTTVSGGENYGFDLDMKKVRLILQNARQDKQSEE